MRPEIKDGDSHLILEMRKVFRFRKSRFKLLFFYPVTGAGVSVTPSPLWIAGYEYTLSGHFIKYASTFRWSLLRFCIRCFQFLVLLICKHEWLQHI